jgi:transporter family protein
MSVSLGILFGLISMLGYGLSTGMAKSIIKKIGNQRTIFFRNTFISLILFVTLTFFLGGTNFSLTYIGIAFVVSLIGYVPLITFYKALKLGKIGIVSPISKSSIIFTILFSIVFFGESLTLLQSFSTILIVLGIVFISVNLRDLKNSQLFEISSGVPFALVSCLLWGLVYFLLKIPVTVLGPVLTSFILEFGIMIFGGVNLKVSKIGFGLPDRKILGRIFIMALLGSIGTLFYTMGIEIADVSTVIALSFSSPLLVTLYGKFVYKERLRALQYVAILLILAGILGVSYF